MTFKPLDIDRENLTIMGVPFLDAKTLESMADTITSIMYEGFEPTPRRIEIFRDLCAGLIKLPELIVMLESKSNAAV
jgi:hypothetical protein